jgi:flagellar basal body-associated protein FliL
MDNNQNWNNPQQPLPSPPKRKVNWTIIIVSIVIVIAGSLFYLASFLGKNFAEVIEKFPKSNTQKLHDLNKPLQEISNTEAYYELIDEINSDSLFSDSLKVKLTHDLNTFRKNVDETLDLIELYEDGYNDTLPLKKDPVVNKKLAHAYFIKTDRASTLKQTLADLKDKAFTDLPDTTQLNDLVNIISIYDNETAPAYLKETTSWENTNFHQSASGVRANLNTIRTEVIRFENAVLDRYRRYVHK